MSGCQKIGHRKKCICICMYRYICMHGYNLKTCNMSLKQVVLSLKKNSMETIVWGWGTWRVTEQLRTYCFSRGPKFGSQHQNQVTHNPLLLELQEIQHSGLQEYLHSYAHTTPIEAYKRICICIYIYVYIIKNKNKSF